MKHESESLRWQRAASAVQLDMKKKEERIYGKTRLTQVLDQQRVHQEQESRRSQQSSNVVCRIQAESTASLVKQRRKSWQKSVQGINVEGSVSSLYTYQRIRLAEHIHIAKQRELKSGKQTRDPRWETGNGIDRFGEGGT